MGRFENMDNQVFAVAFVDLEGELKLQKVSGASKPDVARAFLYKQFPESEAELTDLNSYEELEDWVERCDCQVDVLPVA
jgi:hypothetical protein